MLPSNALLAFETSIVGVGFNYRLAQRFMTELETSEFARNWGLLIGGAIGLYLAWRRTSASTKQADASLKQADLALRDHIAELFNRAAGQLTDEKLEIRLGAIYTLRQITEDYPDRSEPTFSAPDCLSKGKRQRLWRQ
jgi:hypothetical protein